jgi:nucleotide-binding universal stress UspA family protein
MRILLAVDGSEESYQTTKALTQLSRPEQTLLLHVLDVPKPAYPMMMPEVAQELYTTMERHMREEGERLLHRTAASLPLPAGPVSRRLEVGKPAELILSVAQEQKVDLLVLGARGLGPIRERLFGSVSHRVLNEAPCPILVVNRAITPLRVLLLCLEGPHDAEAMLRFLSTKPFQGSPEITVLTIVPFSQPAWPADERAAEIIQGQLLLSAKDFVEGVADKLSAAGYTTKALAMLGIPSTTILDEVASRRPDLLVMGSHGRKGMTRVVLGSVSHAILHRMPCPVLAIR